MQEIMKIEHLAKSFKKVKVLTDVNLKVNQGEIIALLGRNGAGKSTLIKIINGLLKADSGKVNLFGYSKMNAIVRERTAMMLQDNFRLRNLTVHEAIRLIQSHYAHPLPYNELIELGELENLQKKEVNQLSGGELRRFNFVLAMVGDPQLIFLDEPTTSMDSLSRQIFWEQITLLKMKGKTIFITSHYLDELESVANRILILSKGQIAFDGNLQVLRDKFGAVSVSFVSDLASDVFKQLPSVLSLEELDHRYNIKTQETENLLSELYPYFNQIKHIQIKETSLEVIFNLFEGGK